MEAADIDMLERNIDLERVLELLDESDAEIVYIKSPALGLLVPVLSESWCENVLKHADVVSWSVREQGQHFEIHPEL